MSSRCLKSSASGWALILILSLCAFYVQSFNLCVASASGIQPAIEKLERIERADRRALLEAGKQLAESREKQDPRPLEICIPVTESEKLFRVYTFNVKQSPFSETAVLQSINSTQTRESQ